MPRSSASPTGGDPHQLDQGRHESAAPRHRRWPGCCYSSPMFQLGLQPASMYAPMPGTGSQRRDAQVEQALPVHIRSAVDDPAECIPPSRCPERGEATHGTTRSVIGCAESADDCSENRSCGMTAAVPMYCPCDEASESMDRGTIHVREVILGDRAFQQLSLRVSLVRNSFRLRRLQGSGSGSVPSGTSATDPSLLGHLRGLVTALFTPG